MMRILVIVNAHFGYDGISTVAKGYYKFQDHNKIRMDFLTINHGDADFEKKVLKNGDSFFCLENRNSNPIKYILDLFSIVRKGKYDIVHVHGNSATMAIELLAAKLGGVKCRIAHSHNTKCDHGKIHFLLFPLFRRLHTAGFACSNEAGEFLFPSKKYYVIKNGIDTDIYRYNIKIRTRVRKAYGLDGFFVICNIGRMTYQKNQEFLIDLLSKMNDPLLKLLLVGDGENREALLEKGRTLGVEKQLVFTGNINNVNEILQAADIFVFPSRFEGLGIVALEAQASSIPCLVSDVVPHEVAVTADVKFLSLEHPEDWSKSIIELKNKCSQTVRESEADGNVKKIKKAGFDIRENCKSLLQLYEKLCK